MFQFASFYEMVNSRIRYNESLINFEDISGVSITDFTKQYPPQQIALPSTPTLKPTINKSLMFKDPKYVLRRTLSPAKLRLSKSKSTDYMRKFERWVQRKYQKWKEKQKGDEIIDDEWDSFDEEDEFETDSDYDDIDDFDDFDNKQQPRSPIQQQQELMKQAKETTFLLPPAQLQSTHVVSSILKEEKSTFLTKLRRKRKRKKKKKKDIKWKGDERKRLKVCISALMQMRFHNQVAYSGLLSSITLYMRTRLEMTSSSAAMVISVWTGLCYITPLLSAYLADAKYGRANTLLYSQYVFLLGMFAVSVSTYFGTKMETATHTLFWSGMIIIGFGFGGFKPTLSPLGADQFDAKHKQTEEQKKIAKEKRSSFFGWLYWANQVGGIFAASVIAYICQNIDFSIGWSLGCIALVFSIASFYSAKNYFICVPPEGSVFGDFIKASWYAMRAKCKGIEPPTPMLHSYPSTVSMGALEHDEANISPLNLHKTKQMVTPPIKMQLQSNKQPSVGGTVYLQEPSKLNVMMMDKIDVNADTINDDNNVYLPQTPQTPQNIARLQSITTAHYTPLKPSIFDLNKQSHGGDFDDFFIEDIKAALSALPALIPFPVAYIIYTNLLTLVYSQGCQMNIHMGNGFVFPISALSLISTITIILFVPSTEKFIYPAMNRKAKNDGREWLKVTPLKKMAGAFTCAIIAMLISAITEVVRKSKYVYQFPLDEMSSPCGSDLPVSDMSILWQSPQFFLLGISRVLINTGAQDFFYTEAPKSMKSTLFSLNYAVDGVGAVLGSVSIIIVNSGNAPWITNNLNDGHLEYYFITIGAIMCVLFTCFLIFAKNYTYKEFKKLKRGKKLRGKG